MAYLIGDNKEKRLLSEFLTQQTHDMDATNLAAGETKTVYVDITSPAGHKAIGVAGVATSSNSVVPLGWGIVTDGTQNIRVNVKIRNLTSSALSNVYVSATLTWVMDQ